MAGVVAGQQRSSLPHRREQDEIVKRHPKDAQNVPMTSQPSRARFLVRATARMCQAWRSGRCTGQLLGFGTMLMARSQLQHPAGAERQHSRAAGAYAQQANLIKAADLPPPIGGGKVIRYDRNARSLDQLSICQTQPLNALGASAIKSRSFQCSLSLW